MDSLKLPEIAIAPNVVRNEFFGCTVFERSSGEYLALTEDVAQILRLSRDMSLEDVFAFVYGERATRSTGENKNYRADFAQLIRSLESRGMMSNGRFVGEFLDNVVPSYCNSLVAPNQVHFQLTDYCAYDCKYCWIKRYKIKGMELSTSEVKKLFRQLVEAGTFVVNIGGGQAIARSDFEEVVDYANHLGLQINLSTNCSSLVDKYINILNRLNIRTYKVGIAAGTEKAWNALRGRSAFRQFKRGLGRLAELVSYKPESRIVFSAVIVEENREDISAMIKLLNRLCIELNIVNPVLHLNIAVPFPTSNVSDVNRFIGADRVREIIEKIHEYNKTRTIGDIVNVVTDSEIPLPSSQRNLREGFGCHCGQLRCFISAQGYVYPSAIVSGIYPADNSISLHYHSFSDIWLRSMLFRSYRTAVANDECQKCEKLNYCHGGCRSRAMLYSNSRSAKDPWCLHEHQ